MTRKLVVGVALAVGMTAMTAASRGQNPPQVGAGGLLPTKTLKFVYMDPAAINVEGEYPGSGHTGGGMMACMARWEYTLGMQTWTEDENVSDRASWSIQWGDIYWIEEDVTLFDDGLWVNPYFIDVVDGYSQVYAEFEGKRAVGEISVCDYR